MGGKGKEWGAPLVDEALPSLPALSWSQPKGE